MGFGDFLGSFLGEMAAQGQEMMRYKAEYENWSDRQLKTEYNRLRSAGKSDEIRFRRAALASVLRDRGYGQQ